MKKLLAFILSIVLLLCCGCFSYEPNSPAPLLQSELCVYYIDVGQADCALITVNNKTMLIDGGNASDGPYIIEFIKELGITALDVIVATHPHEDHIGGLASIVDAFTVKTIYSAVDSHQALFFQEFKDVADRQCGITICKTGEKWMLDKADVSVLWPNDIKGLSVNDLSIVLKVSYGLISFLFTGDLEKSAETALIESGADLNADVLKVGHHGSESSSSYYFLRSIMPGVGIISCGKDNVYGHPNKEPLERLKQADVTTFRTDEVGTIAVRTDGETFTVFYENFEATFENSPDAESGLSLNYIGNKKSKVFHYFDCAGLPKRENRVSFSKRDDAIQAGFRPCGSCKP